MNLSSAQVLKIALRSPSWKTARPLVGDECGDMVISTQEAAHLLKKTPKQIADMLASRAILHGWRTGDDNASGHWRVQLREIQALMPQKTQPASHTRAKRPAGRKVALSA